MRDFDAIVVGAGVAGSSTAYLLGREGHRVLLLDRAVFPRSKVCGEGLMPAGVQILRRLGIDGETLGGRPFPGIRFRWGNQQPIELDFRETDGARHGLAVSRESLDDSLARAAARLTTVELRQNFAVTSCRRLSQSLMITGGNSESFSARVLVAADGIRSRFHSIAGCRRLTSSGGRFALRALCRDYAYGSDWVDVYCGPRGEAYVAPLDGRSARVTLLLNPANRPPQPESRAAWFEAEIAAFPQVRSRFAGRPKRPDVTAPVSRTVSRCHGDRLLLVGDAAGAVDPITGQGMTLALRDALLAAETLHAALRTDRLSEADLEAYTRRRQRYFAQANELSRGLLLLLKHPWLIAQVRRALAGDAGLRRRLLAAMVNPGPSSGLRWTDRLRLVVGY